MNLLGEISETVQKCLSKDLTFVIYFIRKKLNLKVQANLIESELHKLYVSPKLVFPSTMYAPCKQVIMIRLAFPEWCIHIAAL